MELLNLPIEMHNCILNEIKDDSTTSAFTVLNKVTMVSKYFQPLATENIVIRNLVPKAKFRKGSIVRYNQEWVKQCKERLEPLIKQYGGSLGQQPFGRLTIYSDPRWDSKNKTFGYAYEYGMFGDHEGYALEKDLQLYSSMIK